MKTINIFDTITLLRAGYTKKEIEVMKAEPTTDAAPQALSAEAAPVDMPDKGEEIPAPASPVQPAEPEEDPRVVQLEAQVKELQAKLIQLNTVGTIPAEKDVMLDIGNTLINGGKKL